MYRGEFIVAMEGILREKPGAPITVLSVQEYSKYTMKNERKENTLFIVYKDEENKKRIREIKSPEMEIYFVKPEYRDFRTPREYIEIDKTYSKKVKSNRVLYAIKDEMMRSNDAISQVMLNAYNVAESTGNWSARKEIYKWPYTLMSDLSVEEYYRIMLGYNYETMRNHLVDKAFLDIEADTIGFSSSEQAQDLDTVNACTLIFSFDEHRKKPIDPIVFTFLLRNYSRYPQQKEFEKHVDAFIKHCHDTLDEQTISKDGKNRVIKFPARYKIQFFDSEMDLIVAIFNTINYFRPDILSVWNIAYDIPKLAHRLEYGGLNYVDIMCGNDFPKDARFVDIHVDKRAGIDIADRKTYIRMASTTLYNDQMQTYAGIRKGRKAFGSSKLDNIAKLELGLGKHTFDKGITVLNAAMKDYYNFVYYNIIDVVRQYMIDLVTNDCVTVIYDMNQSNCPLENLFKQTKYQKQIYYVERLRKGFVSGNNPNVNYIRGYTEDYMIMLEELEEAKKQRQEADAYYDDPLGQDAGSEDDESDDEKSETYDVEAQAAAEQVAGDLLGLYDDSIKKKLILQGGLVANPDLNSDIGTELLDGVMSKHVYDDVMDMDYASEYPWAKYTRNLSKSTQIGRLVIPHKVSQYQNALPIGQEKQPDELKTYLPGAEFSEDYLSKDILSFGRNWFNLPTTSEMYDIIQKRRKDKS